MTGSWTGTQKLPSCPVDLKNPPQEHDLRYLVKTELAKSADDILWRRTKWGLHLSQDQIETIKQTVPNLVKEIEEHGKPEISGD